MYYEKETGLVHVLYEYRRGKTKKDHRFNGKPTFLQLDPDNPNIILSVHFEVSPPEWMKDFADSKGFVFFSVNRSADCVGFSLIKVNDNFNSVSPTLEGKLIKWFYTCTPAHVAIKDELLFNIETVKKNLKYYPEVFAELEFYYRPSEFDDNFSAINFKKYGVRDLIEVPDDANHDELTISMIHERSERWEKLKEELIMVREYPEETEVIPSVIEEPVEIEAPVITELTFEIEAPVIAESTFEIEAPVIAEPTFEIETPVIAEPTFEIDTAETDELNIEMVQPVITDQRAIKEEYIVKKSNKKAGLIAGQMLFF